MPRERLGKTWQKERLGNNLKSLPCTFSNPNYYSVAAVLHISRHSLSSWQCRMSKEHLLCCAAVAASAAYPVTTAPFLMRNSSLAQRHCYTTYEVHQAETPNPRSTICYTTQTIQAQVVPAKLCPTTHATQPRACRKTVATAAAHSLLAALLTPQPFRPVHTATDTCAAAPTGGMHAVIAAAAQSLLITVCLLHCDHPQHDCTARCTSA